LPMGVVLTVWVDGNETTYKRQRQEFFDVLGEYGSKHVDGVSVGNEVLFRAGGVRGNLDSDAFTRAKDDIVKKMKEIKERLKVMGFEGLPVFTSDLGANMEKDIVKGEDMVLANIHPYFAGIGIDKAAEWTLEYWRNKTNSLAKNAGKVGVISEIGWPTRGTNDANTVPSIGNLNKLLQSFICNANNERLRYYWFEAFDEPWKKPLGDQEASWGLFDRDRNLKDGVQIPDCVVPARKGGLENWG